MLNCCELTQSLKNDNFLDLVETVIETWLKLIEDLVETVICCNVIQRYENSENETKE